LRFKNILSISLRVVISLYLVRSTSLRMELSINQDIGNYKKQMELGVIPKAYRALMEYMMNLRIHLTNQYPTEFIIGSFYQGYMNISYFPITPKSLKSKKLKTGLVFNHKKVRFEIWLVGRNKQTQKKYWEFFKNSDWNKYPISKTPQHSIFEHILVENPNFDQLDMLTEEIENGAIKFIKEIADFFA